MTPITICILAGLMGVSISLVVSFKSSRERLPDVVAILLWIVVSGIFVFHNGLLSTQLEEERAQRYELQTELKACRDANEDTGSD